jgi:hypothetical protein
MRHLRAKKVSGTYHLIGGTSPGSVAPFNLLDDGTGTSLCTGCITGGNLPAGLGIQWTAAAASIDSSFTLARASALPAGAPPTPSIPYYCCSWNANAGLGRANTRIFGIFPGEMPGCVAGGNPPVTNDQAFAYLWRSGGNTWNFLIVVYLDLTGYGSYGITWTPVFAGSVVEADCTVPFSITNTLGCGGGGLVSGGTASFTP